MCLYVHQGRVFKACHIRAQFSSCDVAEEDSFPSFNLEEKPGAGVCMSGGSMVLTEGGASWTHNGKSQGRVFIKAAADYDDLKLIELSCVSKT